MGGREAVVSIFYSTWAPGIRRAQGKRVLFSEKSNAGCPEYGKTVVL